MSITGTTTKAKMPAGWQKKLDEVLAVAKLRVPGLTPEQMVVARAVYAKGARESIIQHSVLAVLGQALTRHQCLKVVKQLDEEQAPATGERRE